MAGTTCYSLLIPTSPKEHTLRWQVRNARGNKLLFTCGTRETAETMAKGCRVPVKIVAVRVAADA